MTTWVSLSQLRVSHLKAGSSLQTSAQRVEKRSLPALQQSNIMTPCVSRHFLEARSSCFTTSCTAVQYRLGADATQMVDSCAVAWMLPQALTPQSITQSERCKPYYLVCNGSEHHSAAGMTSDVGYSKGTLKVRCVWPFKPHAQHILKS